MVTVTDTATERLTRRVLTVCDAVGEFFEYWGFKAVYGRVWALLALSDRPLTQAAIAETLGVSRSLISGAIGELRRLGLVQPTRDHRNAPFEAILDVWPTISEVLRAREWLMLERARGALEAAIEEAELLERTGRPLPYDLARMRLLLSMTEAAQSLLRLLIGLRIPKSIEGFGRWFSTAAGIVRQLQGGR